MRRALALAILVSFIGFAHAGDKKPITPERVGQLLTILRSDLNEDNRTHAAEELGRVDASHYPEIIPLLIETMRSDPKPAVRAEVVDSLAKIRPLSKEAGKAARGRQGRRLVQSSLARANRCAGLSQCRLSGAGKEDCFDAGKVAATGAAKHN